MDGRTQGAVVVQLLGCGLGVDEPHIAVLLHGGINGCLSCRFRDGEDVRCMLMVVHVFACKRVGNVVEVDTDVARLRMLSDVGGLARSGTKEAP